MKGSTIHAASNIPANQKLQYTTIGPDRKNMLQAQHAKLDWLLTDEFSIIGNKMLNFMNAHLQQNKCNKRPFRDVSVIAIGYLYQLKPVCNGYIFQPLQSENGLLATNLSIEHFSMYKLNEILRHKKDKMFAEIVNKLCIGKHTEHDIEILLTQQVSEENLHQLQ